jgi:hypothetical protein
MVKLRMLGKNKVLDASWEGLYLFIGYVDERKWLSLMKEDAYASSRDLMKIFNCFILKHDLMEATRL